MKRLVMALLLAASTSIFGQATGGGGVPGSGSSGNIGVTTLAVPFPTNVSATNPLYLEFSFRQDTQAAFMLYSNNAKNYVQGSAGPITLPTLGSSGIRDIGVLYYPATSTYFLTATGVWTATTAADWTSTDLQNWTVHTVSTSGSPSNPVSPRWFQDLSGNYWVALDNNVLSFYVATFNPATNTFGTFSTLTLSGDSGCTAIYDPRIYAQASNSTYYMFYACAESGVQHIHYATSTTANGTYTRQQSGTPDYFGFGGNAENPDFVVPSQWERPHIRRHLRGVHEVLYASVH